VPCNFLAAKLGLNVILAPTAGYLGLAGPYRQMLCCVGSSRIIGGAKADLLEVFPLAQLVLGVVFGTLGCGLAIYLLKLQDLRELGRSLRWMTRIGSA
jgi:hypothetical protein